MIGRAAATSALRPAKSRNHDKSLLAAGEPWVCAGPDVNPSGTSGLRHAIDASDGEVAAPYVLARLCAMFEGLHIAVGGQSFYKTTWQVALRHKESGLLLTLYDYKGAFSYGGPVGLLTEEYKRDAKALIAALSNDRFPHPYDGCVVGEIA